MESPFKTNANSELIELFRAESEAHIPVLCQGLLDLEKGQVDDQAIASMMRAAHSIKGAARIVGIDGAVRLAHVLEDCFTAAKENRSVLSSEAVDILLQGVDALQRICELQPDSNLTEAWLETVLGPLTAVKEGRTPAAKPSMSPRETEVVPVVVRAQPVFEPHLVLPEDFNDAAAGRLRVPLMEAVDLRSANIRVDFGPVRHVSAQALALLASLSREAVRQAPACTVHADAVSGPLAAMLRVTALERTLIAGA